MSTILSTLCYLRNREDFLMLHRNKRAEDFHLGKWNGLGGKFLDGETPSECVLREVFEESGLVPSKIKLQGTISFPFFDQKNNWFTFVFTGTCNERIFRENSEGSLEWLASGDILSLNLWEGDRIFLPWIFEDRFFDAKFIYKDKKLISHKVKFYEDTYPHSSHS